VEATIGRIIRVIRKRLGKTTSDFAKELHISQPTVSRYETGAVFPSNAVLLDLLHMTSERAEKSLILQAMVHNVGWRGPVLVEDADEVQEYLRLIQQRENPDEAISRQNARRLLRQEVGLILSEDREVSAFLVEIVRYWRRFGHHKDAEWEFIQAAAFLDVRMTLLGRSEPSVEMREPAGLAPSARHRERKRGKQQT